MRKMLVTTAALAVLVGVVLAGDTLIWVDHGDGHVDNDNHAVYALRDFPMPDGDALTLFDLPEHHHHHEDRHHDDHHHDDHHHEHHPSPADEWHAMHDHHHIDEDHHPRHHPHHAEPDVDHHMHHEDGIPHSTEFLSEDEMRALREYRAFRDHGDHH
ncbi:Uncharacterized protein PBTT_08747 [Plasmodiophora brassicae]